MLRVGEGGLASLRPELGQVGGQGWLQSVRRTVSSILKVALEVVGASN